jgi:hypothetical protein
MILYAVRVVCDFDPVPPLPDRGETLRTLTLRSAGPFREFRQELRERFPLYRAHGREVFLHSDRSFGASGPARPWAYEVDGIVTFFWRGGGETIFYRLHEGGDIARLTFWFTHLFFPFYLTLERRSEFLHAGAVERDGEAILFLAPSLGGKSTLTDYFLRRGAPLISDDKVATYRQDDRFLVAASHPYHRPYRAFETLGQRADSSVDRLLPLGALYLLEPSPPDAEVAIAPIHGFARFDRLMPHFLFQFPFLRPEQFRYLGALLQRVPLYRVVVPRDLARLEEVRRAILGMESGR